MKAPENPRYILFGGTFLLANKMQFVGDQYVKGLSTKQWFLLRNMLEMPKNPAPTITQIAEETNSTRQNTTKMLESMQKDGFVEITRSNMDKRSCNVTITEKGYHYLSNAAGNAQKFMGNLYQNISSDELEIAGGVLKKMMENLQNMEDEL